MVAPGDLIGGRYSAAALLAQGGMADVYRARDVVLDRWVAVKSLRAGMATAADVRRFERETRLLAGLEHHNLVRLLDAGHEGDEPFLVLELVEGPTLEQRLQQGPLRLAPARQMGGDLARALAYVHTQGVVHRDVKPSNVLLAPDGRALLSDFGIAQLSDGTRLTATKATIGTAAYLAPEQIDGGPVTAAADVYALGLVLIEALSGQRPFQGTSYEVLVARMVRDPTIPAVVPPSWARLLRAMTLRDPAARPDAAVVAAHLDAPPSPDGATDLVDTRDLADTLPAVAGSAAAGAVAPRRARQTRRARRDDSVPSPAGLAPLWLAALVPLGVITAVVAVVLALGSDRDPSSESAAPSSTSTPSTNVAAPTTAPSTTALAPTTTAPPATTVSTPAAQPQPVAAVSPAARCAELDAQKQALDEQRHQVDETHRHDRETREALRDEIQDQKQAVDDQKRALGC